MPTVGRLQAALDSYRTALLVRERVAAGELVRAYGRSWVRLRVLLDQLLAAQADAIERGEPVDVAWLYRYDRLTTLQRQIEAELRVYAQYAELVIAAEQSAAITAALEHAEDLTGLLLPAGDVLATWTRLPSAALVELIGATGSASPLHDLLAKLGPQAALAARDVLVQGVTLGYGPARVARELRRALGESLARSLVIARTETLRAYREATRLAFASNSNVIEGWVWVCACTPRSCPLCWAMHGTVHPLTERLNDHPNGRCTMAPKVRAVAGMAEQLLPESGAAQFARLTPAAQDAILGQAAGAAYRAGKFALPDVVGERFSPAWGPQLRVKSLAEILGRAEAEQ